MTTKEAVIFAAPMFVYALGGMAWTYTAQALRNGWPVGRLIASSHWPGVIGFALLIASLVISYQESWLHVGATFVGGSILSMILFNVMGKWSQTALFLGPLSLIVALIVMRPGFWA